MTCRDWLLVALCCVGGCTTGGERATRDSAALVVDSGEAPRRLASDATLRILTSARLAQALRAAADSFAAHEAVQVVQESVAGVQTAGGVDTARVAAALGNKPDIVALAAEAFPQALVPARTTWYVLFARDRMVIAHGDSSRAAASIDSTNWWKAMQRRGVRVGRVTPTASPAGYRALLVMQLAEAYYNQPKLAAKLLAASPARYVVATEADLVAGLDSERIDYAFLHESTASAARLRYIRLPHEIDLGEPADSSRYASAEVVVVNDSLGDTVRVRGAPIVFGASMLTGAPSPRYAERLLRFLFTAEGQRALREAYLDVLPRPVVVGSDAPAAIVAALGLLTPAPR